MSNKIGLWMLLTGLQPASWSLSTSSHVVHFHQKGFLGYFFPTEEMACLVDVTGCWWRSFLHCTHGAVSHIRVLAPVNTNSGRLLNFQEFCELIVRSTDTLKLAVQQSSNGTDRGVSCLFDTTFPSCLLLHFHFPQLEDFSGV